MALVAVSGPAVEPVSLSELKLHLRIDGTAEDTFLTSLIKTSRCQIEQALSMALISQTWSWRFDRWPNRCAVEMPLSPVQSVNSISVSSSTGGTTPLAAASYILDGNATWARLIIKSGRWTQPTAAALGVDVTFTAGFGAAADDVPAPIRHALMLLAAHWYGQRNPNCGDGAEPPGRPLPVPQTVSDLLQPFRRPRL